MEEKTINLDSVTSVEKRQELSKLSLGDNITINGVEYVVEQRFSQDEKQAARLVPV